MFNLGMGEITVILLLALIFLGPGKLPDLATSLGKIIREVRKATSDVKNEIAMDDSFRKPFEELRDAVTLHPDELKRRDMLQRAIAEAHAREQREQEAAKAAGAAGPPDGLTDDAKISLADADARASGGPTAGAPNDTVVTPAPPRAATLDDVPTPDPAPAAAKPSLPPPLFGPPAGAVPRATKPATAPAPTADSSNVTQILKEEDLLPGPTGSGPPPPPHLPGLAPPPTPRPGTASLPAPSADKKKTT